VPIQHLNLGTLYAHGIISIHGVSAVELLKSLAISWHQSTYDRDLTNEVDLAVEAISGFVDPSTRTAEKILKHIVSIASRLLADPKADFSPEVRERLKQVEAVGRSLHPTMGDNQFKLYDRPERTQAEAELKAACAKAATEIKAIQIRYPDCGAVHTISRTAIIDFIWGLLLIGPSDAPPSA
jgi:hypothetical protein